MPREIEVLYELKTPAAKALGVLGRFECAGRKETVDTYFFDPKRPDLKPVRGRLFRCFRLRLKGGRAFLTYKIDKFRGDEWLYSDEHETEVGDHATARAIIRHLGLRELVTVKMTKTIFHTEDYEIALEQVSGLGNFLEVESRRTVPASKADAEKERIRRFAEGLGLNLGKETNAGKPELLLAKRRRR